jgi:glutamate synthase (NADPH/NADH) small chain
MKRTPKAPRQLETVVRPEERLRSCIEVNRGFSREQAKSEALRCLHCVDPKCVQACPLHIDIREFIDCLTDSDFSGALETIRKSSPFPSICGRVCQHERFCEKACLLGKKLAPVAIGSLERASADFGADENQPPSLLQRNSDQRVAIVGSGPASLIAAHDLRSKGYGVTVFEALHEPGGVLIYGIPGFRLPRAIVRQEVLRLREIGVEFRTDVLVGNTCSLEDLLAEGYSAVFLGTGAGLPKLMGIPGEDLIGVYTANEFLTRVNLMEAWRFPESDTPLRVGQRTLVVGGGNSAIDAARWARRLGSDTTVLFRRGREQMRARKEEIAHAEQEGVKFEFLVAPLALHGDVHGVLRRMECVRMRLKALDASSRPSPVAIPGSEFQIEVDTVVGAVGQEPNPTVQRASPALATKDGMIAISDACETNLPAVFAGGDVTRGGSTVIEALHDGRRAAESIHRALAGRAAAPRTAVMEVGPRFQIVSRRELAPAIFSIEIEAPEIARHWHAGQFVVVRPTSRSERIPLTLVSSDGSRDVVRLVFQVVGKTTKDLAALRPGESLADVLGPLGKPASAEAVGTVWCVAGGVGIAEVLPVARELKRRGNYVVTLAGARSIGLQILREEILEASDEVHWATDDGSGGFHGNVVDLMRSLHHDRPPGFVHVIGPIPLMRAAAELTRGWSVRTVASLNPIMLDGTGMCGGCRVSVGGRPMFACVDGPEFDAHQVDFDQLELRNRAYADEEKRASSGDFTQRKAVFMDKCAIQRT